MPGKTVKLQLKNNDHRYVLKIIDKLQEHELDYTTFKHKGTLLFIYFDTNYDAKKFGIFVQTDPDGDLFEFIENSEIIEKEPDNVTENVEPEASEPLLSGKVGQAGALRDLGGMMEGPGQKSKEIKEELKEELEPEAQAVMQMFGFGGKAAAPKVPKNYEYAATDELGVKVNKILASHVLPPRAALPDKDFFGHLISFNSLVFIIAAYLGGLFLMNFFELWTGVNEN